jgi:hypothetical protein
LDSILELFRLSLSKQPSGIRGGFIGSIEMLIGLYIGETLIYRKKDPDFLEK